MTKDEILGGVAVVLNRLFACPPGSVTRETTALDVNGWDSVAHIFLMMELETHFGVQVPSERVQDMDNVGDLIDTLAELLPTR